MSNCKEENSINRNVNNLNIELNVEMLDIIPIPMIIVDKNEKIQFINKAYAEFLKKDKNEIIGLHIYNVIKNSRIPLVMKTGNDEIAWRHKFTEGQDAIVDRVVLKDNNDRVMGCFGMLLFNNISELYNLANKNKILKNELKYYKNELKNILGAKYDLQDIISTSFEMKNIKKKIVKIAKSKSTVLIQGESGVGKELIAHSIHNNSLRKEMPFIRINCAAIPETLLESELFGYEEGAFSGSRKGGGIGKFELANGGTIFLDEIGDMPLAMQAKILRILQEKEINKLGSNKNYQVDVRIIAATNKKLENMVHKGTYREDLYYRLNVLNITIPPLRERKDDIPLLIIHILSILYEETGIYKKISDDAMKILKDYEWPGNVRELRSILEKMLFNSEDEILEVKDIPIKILQGISNMPSFDNGLDNIIEQLEKETIQRVLKITENNITNTAEILKISRPRLYRKIEKYRLINI